MEYKTTIPSVERNKIIIKEINNGRREELLINLKKLYDKYLSTKKIRASQIVNDDILFIKSYDEKESPSINKDIAEEIKTQTLVADAIASGIMSDLKEIELLSEDQKIQVLEGNIKLESDVGRLFYNFGKPIYDLIKAGKKISSGLGFVLLGPLGAGIATLFYFFYISNIIDNISFSVTGSRPILIGATLFTRYLNYITSVVIAKINPSIVNLIAGNPSTIVTSLSIVKRFVMSYAFVDKIGIRILQANVDSDDRFKIYQSLEMFDSFNELTILKNTTTFLKYIKKVTTSLLAFITNFKYDDKSMTARLLEQRSFPSFPVSMEVDGIIGLQKKFNLPSLKLPVPIEEVKIRRSQRIKSLQEKTKSLQPIIPKRAPNLNKRKVEDNLKQKINKMRKTTETEIPINITSSFAERLGFSNQTQNLYNNDTTITQTVSTTPYNTETEAILEIDDNIPEEEYKTSDNPTTTYESRMGNMEQTPTGVLSYQNNEIKVTDIPILIEEIKTKTDIPIFEKWKDFKKILAFKKPKIEQSLKRVDIFEDAKEIDKISKQEIKLIKQIEDVRKDKKIRQDVEKTKTLPTATQLEKVETILVEKLADLEDKGEKIIKKITREDKLKDIDLLQGPKLFEWF